MLTPTFTTSQDDEFVTLELRCPYVKSQEVDIFVNECEFKFYVSPYFLRLHFPHPLIEDGRESAKYDIGRGVITVKLPKLVRGTHFEDLDMLSRLLVAPNAAGLADPASAAGAGAGRRGPLIEVMSTGRCGDDEEGEDDEDEDGDIEFNWEIPQEMPADDLLTGVKYGFNNAYTGFASHVREIGREIIDVFPDDDALPASTATTSGSTAPTTLLNMADPAGPAAVAPLTRRQRRIAIEDERFNPEHYMWDYANDEEVRRLEAFRPAFWGALRRIQEKKGTAMKIGNEKGVLEVVGNGSDGPTTADRLVANGGTAVAMEDVITDFHSASPPAAPLAPSSSIPGPLESIQPMPWRPLHLPTAPPTMLNPITLAAEEHHPAERSEVEIVSDAVRGVSLSDLRMPLTRLEIVEPELDGRGDWMAEEEEGDGAVGQGMDWWMEFTEAERGMMMGLPRKEVLVDANSSKSIYLGLVDIMFAYCYDHRTTEGEPTVESAWTIAKLSSTLSCFETFTTLSETLTASLRRSITYPLHRNLRLSTLILRDVAILFKLGRRALLKALLATRHILRGDEGCYILDRLYLEDYCLWVQRGCSDGVVKALAAEIKGWKVEKQGLGWDLDGLEREAVEGEGEDEEDGGQEDE
ncbi:Hsp90 cochaperone shq1 [Irineochytrium annulatum]|nr:Hsp90 cochaperone shq1 [Irineochytrium annulatum]